MSEKEEAVLFVSDRFLEPTFTMEPMGRESIINGRVIKTRGRSIKFRRMPFGGEWRGEHLTSDQDEIEFLRAHRYYESGYVYEARESGCRGSQGPRYGKIRIPRFGQERARSRLQGSRGHPGQAPEGIHRRQKGTSEESGHRDGLSHVK